MKTISLNSFNAILAVTSLLCFIIPRSSKAQFIGFSSFKMLQQADYSNISNYFISDNWKLNSAEDTKASTLKYIIWEKGGTLGAGIKISFDEKAKYRKNIIHYYTFNKDIYNRIKAEVGLSDWKKVEPVIKNGSFLLSYTDGNNTILLGPTKKEDAPNPVYTITMVTWVEYYTGSKYLGKDVFDK